MNNKEVYRTIKKELDSNPSLKAASICARYGASYGGYRYWVERQVKQPNQIVEVVGREVRDVEEMREPEQRENYPNPQFVNVSIKVRLEDLAGGLVTGKSTIEIPLMEMVENLPAERLKEFVLMLGKGRKETV